MPVPGVPELRARIMELDTEIHLQMEVLNAVLDPIARLPLEICSDIFVQSLSESSFGRLGPSHLPTLLLNICHAWSAIAISTPDLWSAIHIEFSCNKHLQQLLPIWLQRARNRPLSVFFGGNLTRWDYDVSAVIWRHGAQLKRLEVVDDDSDEYGEEENGAFGGMTPEMFDHLMGLSDERESYLSRGLPLPEHLSFPQHLTVRSSERGYFADEILKLLRLAPNLVGCEKPGFPSLRRLTFGEPGDYDEVILNYLSLPALKSHENRTVEPNAVIVADVFAALADSPTLHRLTIYLPAITLSDISDSSWWTLHRAVSIRRIQFNLFGDFLAAPPADVLTALRELVNDDIEIHIIRRREDFI
ncbi:hypothetical protein B0H12DRAFT_1241541 [Mycena haematopus]|nr:hypothetical protein B0H12DRAFT_1241541 [Mycena haematopus]